LGDEASRTLIDGRQVTRTDAAVVGDRVVEIESASGDRQAIAISAISAIGAISSVLA